MLKLFVILFILKLYSRIIFSNILVNFVYMFRLFLSKIFAAWLHGFKNVIRLSLYEHCRTVIKEENCKFIMFWWAFQFGLNFIRHSIFSPCWCRCSENIHWFFEGSIYGVCSRVCGRVFSRTMKFSGKPWNLTLAVLKGIIILIYMIWLSAVPNKSWLDNLFIVFFKNELKLKRYFYIYESYWTNTLINMNYLEAFKQLENSKKAFWLVWITGNRISHHS